MSTTCAGCHQPITWVKTKNNKKTCLNLDGTSHWATCPHFDSFRTKEDNALADLRKLDNWTKASSQ